MHIFICSRHFIEQYTVIGVVYQSFPCRIVSREQEMYSYYPTFICIEITSLSETISRDRERPVTLHSQYHRWWWSKDTMSSGYWWRHQMEAFSALVAPCDGNSPHEDVWTNGLANNRETGDLRRHGTQSLDSYMLNNVIVDPVMTALHYI